MFSQHILTIALKTIQYSIDPFIMVLGVFCVIRMLMKYQALNNLHHEVERELGGYVPSDVKVADKTLSADYQLKINLLKERQLKELFDKESAQYIVLSQLTGIFPLLGILGTVAGLMLNVSAENAEQMMSSLNTALSSTLWGLFFAILLRTLDSYKLAPVVYLIESRFSDYETLYHNIQMEQASRELVNSGKNRDRSNKQLAEDGRKVSISDNRKSGISDSRKNGDSDSRRYNNRQNGYKNRSADSQRGTATDDASSTLSEFANPAEDKLSNLLAEKVDVETEMFAEYDKLTGAGKKKEGPKRHYNSDRRADRKYADKQGNKNQ